MPEKQDKKQPDRTRIQFDFGSEDTLRLQRVQEQGGYDTYREVFRIALRLLELKKSIEEQDGKLQVVYQDGRVEVIHVL